MQGFFKVAFRSSYKRPFRQSSFSVRPHSQFFALHNPTLEHYTPRSFNSRLYNSNTTNMAISNLELIGGADV